MSWLNRENKPIIFLSLAGDNDEKIVIYPSQNVLKQFRNLNALAVIKKCLWTWQNNPQWGRATWCMRLYGHNCWSFKHLGDTDVMIEHKTAAGKLLRSQQCLVTAWPISSCLAQYGWCARWVWWTRTCMNVVSPWPVSSCSAFLQYSPKPHC